MPHSGSECTSPSHPQAKISHGRVGLQTAPKRCPQADQNRPRPATMVTISHCMHKVLFLDYAGKVEEASSKDEHGGRVDITKYVQMPPGSKQYFGGCPKSSRSASIPRIMHLCPPEVADEACGIYCKITGYDSDLPVPKLVICKGCRINIVFIGRMMQKTTRSEPAMNKVECKLPADKLLSKNHARINLSFPQDACMDHLGKMMKVYHYKDAGPIYSPNGTQVLHEATIQVLGSNDLKIKFIWWKGLWKG